MNIALTSFTFARVTNDGFHNLPIVSFNKRASSGCSIINLIDTIPPAAPSEPTILDCAFLQQSAGAADPMPG
jgi:hypothetical protein